MTNIDLLGNYGTSGIQRGDRFEWEPYLLYVRRQPDCIDGDCRNIEAHHLIYVSRGGQASDIFAIPLTRDHHHEYHYVYGRRKFHEKYKLDANRVVWSLWKGFFREHGYDLEALTEGITERKEMISFVEQFMVDNL